MVNFKTWIFDQFPRYFKEFDSYKDAEGKGLLERYLESMGEEMDENMIPSISNFLNLFDVEVTPSKFLTYLAEMFGNPPDLYYNEARYRRFLRYITDINKHKGTVKGYEMLFRLFDCTVVVEELSLSDNRYDVGNKYDQGLRYDDGCPTCSYYKLHITDPQGNLPRFAGGPLGAEFKLLRQIISYVEPINAKLWAITIDGSPIASDIWILTTGIWDDSLLWNDRKIWNDGI